MLWLLRTAAVPVLTAECGVGYLSFISQQQQQQLECGVTLRATGGDVGGCEWRGMMRPGVRDV